MRTKFYTTNQELRAIMLKKFVHYLPGYLEVSIDRELSQEIKELANAMDYFEFHFRRYISGNHKTLHRVLFETRRLKAIKFFEPSNATAIIDAIETDLLDNELYELMPRFLKAKKRVLKEIAFRKQGRIVCSLFSI